MRLAEEHLSPASAAAPVPQPGRQSYRTGLDCDMECLTLSLSPQARFTGDLSSADPTVPQELKDLSANAGSRALILARAGDVLWITCQSSFKKIDLSRCRHVRLVTMTPARGPGFISIMAANKAGKGNSVVVDYDRHTDELFDEAKALAEKTGDFLGYEIKMAYAGADC